MKTKFIPKIKKKVNAFLVEEDGKISKKDIMKSGIFILSAALMTFEQIDKSFADAGYSHANNFSETGNCVKHGNHGSHGSHSSHGSHGQW